MFVSGHCFIFSTIISSAWYLLSCYWFQKCFIDLFYRWIINRSPSSTSVVVPCPWSRPAAVSPPGAGMDTCPYSDTGSGTGLPCTIAGGWWLFYKTLYILKPYEKFFRHRSQVANLLSSGVLACYMGHQYFRPPIVRILSGLQSPWTPETVPIFWDRPCKGTCLRAGAFSAWTYLAASVSVCCVSAWGEGLLSGFWVLNSWLQLWCVRSFPVPSMSQPSEWRDWCAQGHGRLTLSHQKRRRWKQVRKRWTGHVQGLCP